MTTPESKTMIHFDNNSKKVLYRMNIALCDDDLDFLKSFRFVLQSYCAKMDWICQISMFHNAKALIEADLSGCHVLFLDIEMPGLDGLKLGSIIHNKYPELLIVFLTAFPQYAPTGYRVRAFRYIIKDRMLDGDLQECMEGIWKEIYASNETIEVQDTERTNLCVRLRDVLYLSGTPNRRTQFHLMTATRISTVECIGKITDFEARLVDKGFLRIHKSTLANMYHINQITSYEAYMSNGEKLRVSMQSYSEICNKYLMWRSREL